MSKNSPGFAQLDKDPVDLKLSRKQKQQRYLGAGPAEPTGKRAKTPSPKTRPRGAIIKPGVTFGNNRRISIDWHDAFCTTFATTPTHAGRAYHAWLL